VKKLFPREFLDCIPIPSAIIPARSSDRRRRSIDRNRDSADSTFDSVIDVIGVTLFKVTAEINRVSRERSDKRLGGSDPASTLERASTSARLA